MRQRFILLASSLITGLFTAVPQFAYAQSTAKPAAPAPAAVTPAPKKVDRTNIKAVVQAFGAAIATGDKATAKSLVFGTPKQLEYVEAMIDDYQAIIRFDKALKLKFRGDADDYLDHYEKYGELSKKADIEMEGNDKATASFEVTEDDFDEEWELVRRGAQWGLDARQFWDPTEDTTISPEQLRKSTKAVDAVTRRLTAGEFSSAEDAVDAFDETQDLTRYQKD